MSTPILPFAMWESGTNQNSVPANDNSLRNQILDGLIISDSTNAQPGSPADGDAYIMTGAATGTQWATFDEFDLAIFDSGTWYAFAPVTGIRVNIAGTLKAWNGSAYVAAGGGSGDVVGPAGAVDGHVALFDGTTGKLIKDGGAPAIDRSTVTAVTPASGTATFDYSLGDYFTLAPTANVTTLAFSNLPGSGHGASLMIRFTQDSSPRTVAWPASFKWAAGTVPAVSTGSGVVDLLAITTFDNGTTWRATLTKAFA